MQTAGIIAEYHPFHSGHAWQIEKARQMGAQTVVVALSSGLVQRGGAPLLPESVRVRAALQAGADLVLAIPAPYAGSGAETFATAGVRVLSAIGCDSLIFGTETADAGLCQQAAQALCSEEYLRLLREELSQRAKNFASARQAALEALCPEAAVLAANPNDNLGVEYARANLMQKAGLSLYPLRRQGVGHHDSANDRYASASHLRHLWQTQGPETLAPYIPAAALPLYRQAAAAGLDLDPAAVDLAVLSRLRMRLPQGFAEVRGVSEGLEFALEKAVRTCVTVDSLCDALTTSRYPRARMRRLIWDAALGWDDSVNCPVPYLHVLGGRRQSLSLLKNAGLPADVSLARLSRLDPDCQHIAAAQAAAQDLGALCRRTPQPMGTAFTAQTVILP